MNTLAQMDKLKINDIDIAYKITGNGDKFAIILQGWGTNLAMYDSIANLLKNHYKVLQFDLPGFGDSTEPPTGWTVREFADFFLQICLSLGIDSATLIGHSYGGRVIIDVASRESFLNVDRIVLIDSAGVMPKRRVFSKLKSRVFKGKRKLLTSSFIYPLFKVVIDDWLSRQGSVDYRNASPVMKQCLVKAVNFDQVEYMSQISQETLLIWGENDDATPLEDAKVMEENFKNAGLVVLEDCGHYSFLEKPVAFARVLCSFMECEE